jgi:Transposase DDE domain
MAPLMALFPPGKGGGEGVARGGKGKGILIHSLTEGNGMPLANRTTPANGDERAQVVPLLDAVKVHTGKRGRPRKRLKVMATDKGYDAKALRQQLRKRGIRAQLPKRVCRPRKTVADRSKKWCHDAKRSGRLPGSRRNIAAWWSGGSALLHASTHFWRSPRSIFGSIG